LVVKIKVVVVVVVVVVLGVLYCVKERRQVGCGIKE
jgi:hypothetical protein